MVSQITDDTRRGTTPAAALLPELALLKRVQRKFEMEALASLAGGAGLLEYLVLRTEQEFAGGMGSRKSL